MWVGGWVVGYVGRLWVEGWVAGYVRVGLGTLPALICQGLGVGFCSCVVGVGFNCMQASMHPPPGGALRGEGPERGTFHALPVVLKGPGRMMASSCRIFQTRVTGHTDDKRSKMTFSCAKCLLQDNSLEPTFLSQRAATAQVSFLESSMRWPLCVNIPSENAPYVYFTSGSLST